MRRVLLRVGIASLSLAVGLGTAEALVRLFRPQDLSVLAPWYESHPVYRFRHYPNMEAQRTWGNPYRLRTNSHGLRAEHDEEYASPHETRIVVHGDSMTFGVGVEHEYTFVQRLHHRLRGKSGAIDVLNLGVSAHSPDLEYLLFLEEGRKYSPRICIIAVCLGNDLEDLTWSPAFRLEGDRLAYVSYEPPLWKKVAEMPPYRWLADHSHLLVLTRYTLADAPLLARQIAAREERPAPLGLALAIYRDFVAAIQNEGAVPLIALLPSTEQIAQRRGLPAQEPFASTVTLYQALLQFCAEHAVTCVDTLDRFARSDVPFDRLFIPGDEHFSAAGHELVADALAEPVERILDALQTPHQ